MGGKFNFEYQHDSRKITRLMMTARLAVETPETGSWETNISKGTAIPTERVITMNAMTKQILWDIKFTGKVPVMVETADRVFILGFVSKYNVSGYVCGIIGDYRSNFKQAKIQETKDGRRFIMADRVRFDVDKIKPCFINREIIERELALAISMKNTIRKIQQDGNDIGYSLENQDYYIQNLTSFLERSEHDE